MKEESPAVSIIIPNYNHELFLKQRIQSVLNQTYQNFEIIILDDYSSDNSRAIIDEFRYYEKVKHIVFNDINSGSPFIQWRKGIDLALGKYIWIAESDDYSDLTFLENVISFIEKEPDAVICYTNSNIVKNEQISYEDNPSLFYNNLFKTKRWSENFSNDGKEELTNYMGGFCTIINASSCVFLKSAFPYENNNIYKFKYCGDWLIWIEMFRKGKIIYIKDTLNYFRIHSNSTVSKFSKVQKAKELYRCLIAARVITQGKSIIPNEILEIIFNLWNYNSLYFFIKNFKLSLIIMNARIDKNLSARVLSLFKNYFKTKFSIL